eukprot:10513733-Alexandrium_andersonii.AAC.1
MIPALRLCFIWGKVGHGVCECAGFVMEYRFTRDMALWAKPEGSKLRSLWSYFLRLCSRSRWSHDARLVRPRLRLT